MALLGMQDVSIAFGGPPVLDHVSNAEIVTLWKWLHAVHRGATK